MTKSKIYPFWLRFWHLFNAVLFLCLIVTGISLQYSGSAPFLIEFEVAIQIHNICGIVLSANYIFFLIVNFTSGNHKHYFKTQKGFFVKVLKQIRYYTIGIFRGESEPFPISAEQKFNPLQQVTYLKIMYIVIPLVILTGFALLFPEILIDEFFGESGLLYTAFLHTIIGFILSLFLVFHTYLGTTGKTMTEYFKAIITGENSLEKKD